MDLEHPLPAFRKGELPIETSLQPWYTFLIPFLQLAHRMTLQCLKMLLLRFQFSVAQVDYVKHRISTQTHQTFWPDNSRPESKPAV